LIETQRFGGDAYGEEFGTAVRYLEIVNDDVDMLLGLYRHVHGRSFGPRIPIWGRPA
jgi:hypothetical protein